MATMTTGGAAAAEHSTPGDTDWALPGIVRVGIPGAAPSRVAVAGTAGYGYTESQGSGDGAHHRVSGTAAVGLTLVKGLDLALRLDGRSDNHPDDGQGAHGTLVGDPRILARYGAAVSGGLSLGAQVVGWMPGKNAPSVDPGAISVDAALLAAYRTPGHTTVGLLAGFRLDRSGSAAPDLARTRPGDRMALGLSDYDAALVGLGVSIPAGSTEILGEVSMDAWVGSGAPSAGKWPLRATAGIRQPLSASLALEARLEGLLSSRPGLLPTDPLVPLEPRVSALVGLRFRLPSDANAAPEQKPLPEKTEEQQAAPEAAQQKISAEIHVVDAAGTPVDGATVLVQVGEWSGKAEGGAAGYRVAGVPPGEGEITITAEGFQASKQPAKFEAGKPAKIDVRLSPMAPSGQLRGLIRSFNGKGLAAQIRVEPVGTETKTDAEGYFTLDVPPGDYEVVVNSGGYKEQRRKVHVDQNGVTVLNADLFEEKKR